MFYDVACRQGYMRDSDSDDCVACPEGTYSDTADAASCTSCPEGETTLYDRAHDASLCYSKIYLNTTTFTSHFRLQKLMENVFCFNADTLPSLFSMSTRHKIC